MIKDILSWQEKRYFIEDNTTSIKALAQWTHEHFDFRSDNGNKLSISTIEQLFGEAWREEHAEITAQKRKKRAEHKEKILHNN